MRTWCNKCTKNITIVSTNACHSYKLITQCIGILCIKTWHYLAILTILKRLAWQTLQLCPTLKTIIVKTQTSRECMRMSKFIFKHQRRIGMSLLNVVLAVTVCGILIMPRTRQYQSQISVVLFVKDYGILGKCFVSACIDINIV